MLSFHHRRRLKASFGVDDYPILVIPVYDILLKKGLSTTARSHLYHVQAPRYSGPTLHHREIFSPSRSRLVVFHNVCSLSAGPHFLRHLFLSSISSHPFPMVRDRDINLLGHLWTGNNHVPEDMAMGTPLWQLVVDHSFEFELF
ncbi:hypothetical protein NE237_026121 [Protea cynaroides]|uniref:Uncharacterized protein n=1 Tax=Protea cynaroides TaxID=273540 RepID=A0A9Q0H4B9_9MAGN|nr:hypothetical protein NE237_026121 [Protea cynaroides]